MSSLKATTIVTTIAILLIIGLLWFAYFSYMIRPIGVTDPLNSEVAVSIAKGQGVEDISNNLFSEDLIRSPQFFKLYGFITGNAHKLKPGLYNFSFEMSTSEIVKKLVSGPGQEVSVLVREGENLATIDNRLSELGVINKNDLMDFFIPGSKLEKEYPFLSTTDSLEGFLFPDTYRFFFESEPEDVAKVFLENFVKKVSPSLEDEEGINFDEVPVLRRGIFTINEIVTIASLIEREVPDTLERRIVADIIYRRLRIDMPLQIDATVAYAEENGDRYDTYKFFGLPPGPIASPGLDAIEAAINPRPSPYLYYLSDPETKETIFAEDFGQHKENKIKYLK